MQYAADITYGTNNEFGFDHLRDNMAMEPEQLVHRAYNYAIVDEVDSILIDEARTPLIISGPASGDNNRWYVEFARLVDGMKIDEDYEVEEKKRVVGVLEPGIEKVEKALSIENLYDPANTPLIGFLNNAIKAKELFKRDRDYVVQGGEVDIVDEHTGRLLKGRRYSEGLHQAIEAKEGVAIRAENQTYASITLQNYFRLYDKLAGMTGTAQTEAAELNGTYGLGVIPIPTNMPMIREDQADLLYKTEQAKFDAVIDDILERNAKGQPVLVGTVSVEKSEKLSKELRKRGIRHNVLNAKQHEQEATVVANAGRRGAVTVATNMAGRGTDIMLGGNPEFLAVQEMETRGLDPHEHPEEYEQVWDEVFATAQEAVKAEHDAVLEAGGLYVLGTERHESRRIDNQLRGRSGPPGRPRRVSVLSVARGRPHAHVPVWTCRVGDELVGAARRHAHRVQDPHARRAQRAGADRGPQPRDPQEHPQVRRRDVGSAHRDLHRAPARARRRRDAPAGRHLRRRRGHLVRQGGHARRLARRLGP